MYRDKHVEAREENMLVDIGFCLSALLNTLLVFMRMSMITQPMKRPFLVK